MKAPSRSSSSRTSRICTSPARAERVELVDLDRLDRLGRLRARRGSRRARGSRPRAAARAASSASSGEEAWSTTGSPRPEHEARPSSRTSRPRPARSARRGRGPRRTRRRAARRAPSRRSRRRPAPSGGWRGEKRPAVEVDDPLHVRRARVGGAGRLVDELLDGREREQRVAAALGADRRGRVGAHPGAAERAGDVAGEDAHVVGQLEQPVQASGRAPRRPRAPRPRGRAARPRRRTASRPSAAHCRKRSERSRLAAFSVQRGSSSARAGGPGVCRQRTRSEPAATSSPSASGSWSNAASAAACTETGIPCSSASRPWPETWSACVWVSSTRRSARRSAPPRRGTARPRRRDRPAPPRPRRRRRRGRRHSRDPRRRTAGRASGLTLAPVPAGFQIVLGSRER